MSDQMMEASEETITISRRDYQRLLQSEKKLASLVDNGLALGRERDQQVLLEQILQGARAIANCDRATIFLRTERDTLSFAMRTGDDSLPATEIPLYTDNGEPNAHYVVCYVALNKTSVLIDDVYSETRFDLSGTKKFSEASGFRTVSMLSVPLMATDGQVLGVLQLLNALDEDTGEVIPFPAELMNFIEAMASQSAVALENHTLLQSQTVLMDSLIKIIAGAIDAKSAYTGGHCERVPQLAFMLAEEAIRSQEEPFSHFEFKSDEEWREFKIGAWLHDCGKVTTPEYVVDKATKLETIYNRIHEIRTRFEVLLRDAEIQRLQSLLDGEPLSQADEKFQARRQQLFDDFEFLAESNVGSEFMGPESIERLQQIGQQTWQRHFDDRLGLSHLELERYNTERAPLPVTETLLSDKPEHIIPRTRLELFDEKYEFKVDVPEHLYNFGELYNLSIQRGTLTAEERFKINEHIIQTIMMLDNLPLPKQLKRVPEYAGTHHETMIGTGYPRRLTEHELSIPARIMVIADIFEALTASDRPYKKAKTLSQSVDILYSFKKRRHIDPQLFDLFLTSGVYRLYGERFLKPEQLDHVDIEPYLG